MQHADKTIEKLTDYLTSREGEVILSDKEEQIMTMVRMAHDLFQAGRFPSYKIMRMMCHHFQCSEAQARMAMADCQIIFGSINIHKKEYHAQLLLDRLVEDISKARDEGDTDTLVKLYREWNRTIEYLPSKTDAKHIPPAAIIYNIFKSEAAPAQLTKAEALSVAASRLAKDRIVDAEVIEDGN